MTAGKGGLKRYKRDKQLVSCGQQTEVIQEARLVDEDSAEDGREVDR